MVTDPGKPILELNNISKSFPGVKALQDVNFSLLPGEVHVLMGENGAGKSTLMKIIAGIYERDSGEMLLRGEDVHFSKPSDSIKHGISMIHQELMPVPYLSIAENIFIGREPVKKPFNLINKKELEKQTKDLIAQICMDLNPWTLLRDLSVSEMQMVEIAKAISINSDIVIMDEPTSAITESEVDRLFFIIKKLKEQNVGIIYISHKMDEIFKIGDRITVLRDGKYIETCSVDGLSRSRLISLMVGRDIENIFPKTDCEIGEVKLSVRNLTVKDTFENVSFEARKGEILGFAGLMGAGRTEVVETVFGIRKKDSGSIFIDGKEVEIKSPSEAIRNGMGIISEDRKISGLVLKMSVGKNLTLATLKKYSFAGFFISRKEESVHIISQIKNLLIKTPSSEQCVNNLSGGNQQKVVIGKWMLGEPQILIMDEPTRGIDVAAKAEIHKLISSLAGAGKTIILISSELPEIIGMCDRVMVMHDGKITGELDRKDFSQERIMHFATNQEIGDGCR